MIGKPEFFRFRNGGEELFVGYDNGSRNTGDDVSLRIINNGKHAWEWVHNKDRGFFYHWHDNNISLVEAKCEEIKDEIVCLKCGIIMPSMIRFGLKLG